MDLSNYHSNYDKRPFIPAADAHACVAGWDAIAAQLSHATKGRTRTVIVVDCYVGVAADEVADALSKAFSPTLTINSRDAFATPQQIDRLVEPFLGGNDPIFGYLCGLTMPQFLDQQKLKALQRRVDQAHGVILIVGEAASTIHSGDVLVYADMPRWEGQLRQRRNEVSNLGVHNADLKASLQYKRSFFVDWRVCDRWKRPLLKRADFFLDTTIRDQPKLAQGAAVRDALNRAAHRPFRVVPFFDPGPWGGQWMKKVCDLQGYTTPEPANYAWCFDCVPEENSLLLGFAHERFELPSVNLVFQHPRQLLGDPVHARFGDEFPIRFDFLDTIGGGNLSFQVHPLVEYAQSYFGMHYTQEESYYLLAAEEDGTVYLGLKEGIDPQRMIDDLVAAQQGGPPFDADKYANLYPAKAHDHFLIPPGTVHCSGRNTMVLEISATPYIFTFKLWDWGRLGLDGLPRPINLERGKASIQWDRTDQWVRRELINQFELIEQGDGWRHERTGLHRREFIETRRHWFNCKVDHDTGGIETGSVNVLNLVQGKEAIVESPDGVFDPFIVHYAETFIVPAAVGRYTIRPHGPSEGQQCATIKAYVRRGLGEP